MLLKVSTRFPHYCRNVFVILVLGAYQEIFPQECSSPADSEGGVRLPIAIARAGAYQCAHMCRNFSKEVPEQ